jgi:hypothetical protein
MSPRLPTIFGLFLCLPACHAAITIAGASGLTVTVQPGGAYDISAPVFGWHFGGSVGAKATNLGSTSGADGAGPYSEIGFDFQSGVSRHATIRAYYDRMALLFTVTCPSGCSNTFPFPTLSRYPKGLSHVAFSGMFAHPTFGALCDDSPWAFFDDAGNTFIFSAASNFMTSSMTFGANGELAAGTSSKITSLPPGFTNHTMLVMDRGINRTFDSWGNTLTALSGKTRPANDADAGLKTLGYWTDAGSSYYYATEPGLSYPATLQAVKAAFERRGIALGYMQLDSWFYPKGSNADWTDRADGMYQYFASAPLFGMTLAAFQSTIGVPLITHGRWIDAVSPYRQQYQMSGNVSTDSRYWDAVGQYLSSARGVTYEQDWLSDRAQTDFNLTDPDAFLDHMSASLSGHGVTMQYCMATTRHFLQGSKYSNLTSIRASEDRFDHTRWSSFLYASRLASALGIWPYTDVLMSGERDNLLLATLSAGPVGIGDRIDAIDSANLLHAARADGVIVKPDFPLEPIDRSYVEGAKSTNAPLVASTYSDFGGSRAAYVFSYGDGATFQPSEVGLNGPVYVYHYFADRGELADATDVLTPTLTNGWSYEVVAPIGKSGMAVIGDTGQFVTLGKSRIAALSDDGDVHVTVSFARGERYRAIQGYSPDAPAVSAGSLRYDGETGRFTVTLTPGANATASVTISRGAMPATRSGVARATRR